MYKKKVLINQMFSSFSLLRLIVESILLTLKSKAFFLMFLSFTLSFFHIKSKRKKNMRFTQVCDISDTAISFKSLHLFWPFSGYPKSERARKVHDLENIDLQDSFFEVVWDSWVRRIWIRPGYCFIYFLKKIYYLSRNY